MGDSQPRLEARPASQLGAGWCVQVIWKSGKTDAVTGFVNQHEALQWIKYKAANWIADKIIEDPQY